MPLALIATRTDSSMHAGLLRVEPSRILYSGWSHVYVHFVQHIHHVGRALLHGSEAISKYLHARFDMCFGICTVWQNVFKGIDSRQSLFISLAEVIRKTISMAHKCKNTDTRNVSISCGDRPHTDSPTSSKERWIPNSYRWY